MSSSSVRPVEASPPAIAANNDVPKFSRRCETLAVSIIVLMFAAAVTYYCLAYKSPKYPAFRVRDLAVSNFSTSPGQWPGLAATWEANLTVVNLDNRYMFLVGMIHGFVHYNSTPGRRLSALNPLQPVLVLDMNSNCSMTIRTNMTELNTLEEHGTAAPEVDISQELRETGFGTFSLEIHLTAVGWIFSRGLHGDIYCEGLNVAFQFSGGMGFGTLSFPTNSRNRDFSCRSWYYRRFSK